MALTLKRHFRRVVINQRRNSQAVLKSEDSRFEKCKF